MHVEPQVFDVLTYLIEHRDRVVTKSELLESVWGHDFVSESALTTGSSSSAKRWVIRDGTSASCRPSTVAGTASSPRSRRCPGTPNGRTWPSRPTSVRTFTSARRATAHGSPTPPSAQVHHSCGPHWITHLDYDWQSPVWRHWLVGLARGRQFIRYDERGCGLSAHDVDDFSLDAFVQDLEAVVDDLGLERFPLLGVSQGGAMAITYAARHPERVSHLILLGATPKVACAGPSPTNSVGKPRSSSRSCASAGVGRTRPSGASSPRRSSPTLRRTCGSPSPNCSGARRRPRTRRRCSRRGP